MSLGGCGVEMILKLEWLCCCVVRLLKWLCSCVVNFRKQATSNGKFIGVDSGDIVGGDDTEVQTRISLQFYLKCQASED